MSWEDRRDRIDHAGPGLLWRQVAADLAAEIESGALRPGARLPAEAELVELYGVSRATIRRAIADLVARGLVVVQHGRGTYVSTRGTSSR